MLHAQGIILEASGLGMDGCGVVIVATSPRKAAKQRIQDVSVLVYSSYLALPMTNEIA